MCLSMVSVIVPVYQVSEYVERCLRSVMAQTYAEIECIIVDDATKDDSIEKCERLIGPYTGPISFRIVHHDHNRGLSASRNTGVEASRGDYLYFLDSDDYITPDCIERLASVVKEDPSVEMVQGYYLLRRNDREENNRPMLMNHPIKTENLDATRKEFYKNRTIYISVWNKLLKKSFVEEYGLYCREGVVFEDLLWLFYLLKNLKRAYIFNGITYYYCLRPGSISMAAKPESVGCYALIFDEIFHHLTPGREREEIEGFLYYFIKRYISYIAVVPALKDTLMLYRSKARQYHCWYVYVLLSFVGVFGRLGKLPRFMGWMNGLRWRSKRIVSSRYSGSGTASKGTEA